MPMILDSPSSSTTTALEEVPIKSKLSVVPSKATDPQEWRRRVHHEADVVIVGAGVVGCASAVAFAKQGRSVTLLEKNLSEPDRIVGELLQPGGVHALEKLGMRDCLEGIDAIPCYGYQVSYHKEPVHIPYPPRPDTGKRSEGRSFHHGRFIMKLREAARREPNVSIVQTKVTEVVKETWTGRILGVQCETGAEKNKDFYFGSLTLVADGYASVFRKSYLPNQPQVRSKFWALELLGATLPLPNHGLVILSNAPPILVYQIGTNETRILMDIPENCPTARPAVGGVRNHMLTAVLPELPTSIHQSFRAAVERGKFRSMPNSFLPPSIQKTPGLVILGDAMNMRHPLTGGGMTVGLNDVVILSNLLSPSHIPNLENTSLIIQQMRHFHWARKSSSSVINILAMALYSLFAADDSLLTSLQNGCFRYFQRGGTCVSEPCGLLAGLIGRPVVLVSHFFSVAFYAIWVRFLEASWWRKGYVLLVESLLILWKACVVIGPYLVWEVRR